MREVACQLGPEKVLSAVVTLPDRASGLGCVLVTAGLLPKHGPHRLYALLARELARIGVTVMRFDLGGIGDSAVNRDLLLLQDRTVAEIRTAIDLLMDQYPVGQLILCGLCSGAEDSFRYAETDARVNGIVLIDPFSYRTSGWATRHLLFRARRRIMRMLSLYQPLGRHENDGPATARSTGTLIKYDYIEPEVSERVLTQLIQRNVRLQFIYTGGAQESFNHPGQLQKMFPKLDFRGLISVEHLPWLEHTQMLAQDRETVIARITGWVERSFRTSAATQV